MSIMRTTDSWGLQNYYLGHNKQSIERKGGLVQESNKSLSDCLFLGQVFHIYLGTDLVFWKSYM